MFGRTVLLVLLALAALTFWCAPALAVSGPTTTPSVQINKTSPAQDHVYAPDDLPSGVSFSATGSTSLPGVVECRLTVTGQSSVTKDWTACNNAPFSYTSTPQAPANRSDWTGGYAGVSTNTEGVWTLQVRTVVDSVTYSDSLSWKVDNTAPVVDLTSVPALTNDSTPALPFVIIDANPGASSCGVGDSGVSPPSLVPCVSPYTPVAPLADGPHYLWVYHGDATGNFSHQGYAKAAFTVDTTPPSVSLDAFTTPSTSNTQLFTFLATGGGAPECRYFLAAGSAASWGPCTSGTTFSTPSLGDGEYTVEVRSSDTAGNVGIDARNFTIDTTGPTVTIDSPQAGVLKTAKPNPAVSAADPAPGSGVATLLCAYDAETPVDCEDSAFLAKSLSDGQHTFTAVATDAAGNSSTSAVVFSVDTFVPPSAIALPSATAASFKRIRGKVVGAKYRPQIRVTIGLPASASATGVCAGKAKITLKIKPKGRSAKTFAKSSTLSPLGDKCLIVAKFAFSKSYRSSRAKASVGFAGSDSLGAFAFAKSLSSL